MHSSSQSKLAEVKLDKETPTSPSYRCRKGLGCTALNSSANWGFRSQKSALNSRHDPLSIRPQIIELLVVWDGQVESSLF